MAKKIKKITKEEVKIIEKILKKYSDLYNDFIPVNIEIKREINIPKKNLFLLALLEFYQELKGNSKKS
jgi:hypothetical protein